MSKIAAFFDVDGTIFRNSLLIEHFKLLIKYDFLNVNAWTQTVKDKYRNWTNRRGDYEEYLLDLSDRYVEGLKEISQMDSEYVAKRVIELKGNMLYKYSKDILKWHKDNAHMIIIISGSPDFLVKELAKKLGIEDYKATKYIVKNNKYTGDVIPMWDSKSKYNALKEFEKQYNLDLSKSYAYGDTTGDLTMLQNVGNPVAINPANRLLTEISKDEKLSNKTKIIIERKDVIYELKVKDINFNKEGTNDFNK